MIGFTQKIQKVFLVFVCVGVCRFPLVSFLSSRKLWFSNVFCKSNLNPWSPRRLWLKVDEIKTVFGRLVCLKSGKELSLS